MFQWKGFILVDSARPRSRLEAEHCQQSTVPPRPSFLHWKSPILAAKQLAVRWIRPANENGGHRCQANEGREVLFVQVS